MFLLGKLFERILVNPMGKRQDTIGTYSCQGIKGSTMQNMRQFCYCNVLNTNIPFL